MTSPLVSAIMPTFNQVAFVDDAIRTAVEQDYPYLQLVVSDDGSSDGTVDIILDWARRYPDRVVPIVGQENLGVTGNCNRALAQCRGELQAFHAGDDLWLPGKITRQVEWLVAHPGHTLCSHDVEVFDSESGRRMRLWSEGHPLAPGDSLDAFVRYGNPVHPLGNMVRAAALPPGGYDPRIPLVSDWKFFVDVLARGTMRYGFIDGVYARYRQWPGNVSKRENEMLDGLLTTLDLIEEAYPEAAYACHYRRGALLLHGGQRHLDRGEHRAATSMLLASLRARPAAVTALLLVFSILPPSVSRLTRASIEAVRDFVRNLT